MRLLSYICAPKELTFMYAIVEIAGLQYKVRKDQKLFVHRLDAAEGKSVSFDRVLLAEDKDGKVTVGAPVINGAKVGAKVEAQVKADKVIIFKKKRRKGYEKKNGHRQPMTEIRITSIKLDAAPAKKAAAKKDEAPKAEAAAKKPAAKKPAAKKPAAKKPAAKKPAAKKPAAKKPAAKKTTAAKKPAAKKETPQKED